MKDLKGKEVIFENKKVKVMEVRKTSDMTLAYLEGGIVVNLEILRDLKGRFLV